MAHLELALSCSLASLAARLRRALSASLAAVSKTSRTPSFLNEEHSHAY